MSSEQFTILLGFLTIFGIAFLIYRGVRPAEAVAQIQEVESVGRMAVLAAEEYGRTGRLVTSEDKLRFAASVFRKWIPASRGVTDETMLEVIHSFVPLANSLGANISIEKSVGGKESE